MIDSTFYGSLWGAPRKKRIYDWYKMQYVQCVCIDLGRAYSIGAKASPYDDPNYQPKNKGKRPDANCERVYEWLKENGPAYVPEIAEELHIPQPTVSSALKRHPDKFRHTPTYRLGRDNVLRSARLWEVVG